MFLPALPSVTTPLLALFVGARESETPLPVALRHKAFRVYSFEIPSCAQHGQGYELAVCLAGA